jgi:hypothetical protein
MRELMDRGRVLADPRSTGLALSLSTWIDIVQESYSEALEGSEQALTVAITPQDRTNAVLAKGCALVLLGQTEAGAPLLHEVQRRCVSDGDLYRLNGSDTATAVCKVLQGAIGGASVSLKMQYLNEKERAINSWRIGTALTCARSICR